MQRSRRRCEGTAMGSIVVDLRPGLGIGPFSLGMPICEAFAQIEQQPNVYDVVHVKYFDEVLLDFDIVYNVFIRKLTSHSIENLNKSHLPSFGCRLDGNFFLVSVMPSVFVILSLLLEKVNILQDLCMIHKSPS
ncbi:hypothetical protein OROHE_024317 [Orobanche hederae]